MKQPGSLVQGFASKRKWQLADCNLIVEGELDRDYCNLANILYLKNLGKSLFCEKFNIFPVGEGEEGGTVGILRDFPVLRRLIDIDLDEDSRRVFASAVLLDDDASGRGAKNDLCSAKYNYEFCRDVFLIHRSFKTSRNPFEIRSHFEKIKMLRGKEDLFCEIEDLIDNNLIQEFSRINNNIFRLPPKKIGSESHYSFKRESKRALFNYVKDNAILSDLSSIIEMIKFFRYFFLGDNEGVQV